MASIELNFTNVSWGFGAMAALIGVTAAVTWEIRTNDMEGLRDQIKSYETATQLTLPKAVGELRQATKELQLKVAEQRKLKELEEKVAELTSHEQELQSRLEKTREETSALRTKVASLRAEAKRITINPKTFEIAEHAAETLIPLAYALGLDSIYSTSEVTVNLNAETKKLRAGNKLFFKYLEQDCTVTLTRIEYDTAQFTFGCVEGEKE